MRSWSALGLIFTGFGRLPGASWAALGRSWGALGRSWPPLGRILGASLVLLGPSWLPTAAQDGLGLDFSSIWVGFWLHLGLHLGRRATFLGRTWTSCHRIDMVRAFLQETRIEIHSGFSFSPCSAAVRAQHIRRLPKGCRACQILIISSSLCLPLRLASRIRLQIPSSKAFPHPFVPSPGPARTAALRPQFALEASKCDFFAFQKSSCFLLPFFLEKIAKIIDFGLPKPFQNPLKTPSKSTSQKTCYFS